MLIKKKKENQSVELSALILDKKTTGLPTPEFNIRKNKLKKEKNDNLTTYKSIYDIDYLKAIETSK